MHNSSNDILNYVLSVLSKKEIPLDKIVLQKVMHFLKEMGIPHDFRFEPYTYGPFSSQLAHELGHLVFWDYLSEQENKHGFNLIKQPPCELESKIKHKIESAIDKFSSIVDNQYDFQTMELFGTVLSCYRALEEVGEKPIKRNVVSEFIGWKGNKYSKSKIEDAYARIKQILN